MRAVKKDDGKLEGVQHTASDLPGLILTPVGGTAQSYGLVHGRGYVENDVTISDEGRRQELVRANVNLAASDLGHIAGTLDKRQGDVEKADAALGAQVHDLAGKLHELEGRGRDLSGRVSAGTIDAETGAAVSSFAAEAKAASRQVEALEGAVKERTGVDEVPKETGFTTQWKLAGAAMLAPFAIIGVALLARKFLHSKAPV